MAKVFILKFSFFRMKLQNRCNCSSSADCSDLLESLLVAWQPRGDNKTAESPSVWLLYAKKPTEDNCLLSSFVWIKQRR